MGPEGHCDPAFTPVAEAFWSNFTEREEIGASVALSVGGRMVVDLWGGSASAGRAWAADTLVDVFSVGKAMVAVALLVLVERGRLAFDDPVARHWPEFAAAAKGSVSVAQLLSHQGGLPGIRRPLPADAMYRWDLMCGALAAEEPWWEPGTAHGYHVNTLGFLGGELVRRVSGQPFARFFATEVAGPVAADFHFGLVPAEMARAADFEFPPAPAEWATSSRDDAFTRLYANPPGLSGIGTVNTAAWRAAVHPSTNGHANARAVARVYAALVDQGRSGGVALLGPGTLEAATTELVAGPDRVLERSSRFGFGFQLPEPDRPLGPGPSSFGHFGAGGSLGMGDPEAELAFGYVMNRFGHRWQDPRNQVLLAAAYSCL